MEAKGREISALLRERHKKVGNVKLQNVSLSPVPAVYQLQRVTAY